MVLVATLNAMVALLFPQTNRILLAHVKQNGDIPSTKEVRVLSARTVLISGNASVQLSGLQINKCRANS